jgi:hypothetical protein
VFETGGNTYRVDFKTAGQQEEIVVASGNNAAREIQHIDLRSLTGYADGVFRLTFDNPTTFFNETTPLLSVGATADEIEAALNNLSSVQALRTDFNGSVVQTGAVEVTETAPGQFDIAFNIFGSQPAIVGSGAVASDRFPVTVTETTHGALETAVASAEQISGATSAFSATETTTGDVDTNEVQQLNLSSVSGKAHGDFTLTFNGQTTEPLLFSATGVPPTPQQVQDSLNDLALVQAAGGVVVTGTGGVYDVVFGAAGDQPALTAAVRNAEVQQLDLGIVADPLGKFTLAFGADKTVPLTFDNTTAEEIEIALNELASVNSAGGVDVTKSSEPGQDDRFLITFRQLGDVGAITAAGLTQSVQRINLGELPGRSDTQFKLTFNGQTTGLISADLAPDALAAAMESALNQLDAVKDTQTSPTPSGAPTATGAVTVTAGNGDFTVTFNTHRDVPAISGFSVGTKDRALPVSETNGSAANAGGTLVNGSANASEVQFITVGSAAEFQLEFDNNPDDGVDGYATPIITPGATDIETAIKIGSALNELESIIAAGGVSVSTSATPGTFNVNFSASGDQPQIAATVGLHEQQIVDVKELAKLKLPVTTTTNGGDAVKEVQTVDLTGVTSDFALEFMGRKTASLRADATVDEIRAALNVITSAAGQGLVEVVGGPDRTFIINFADVGDKAQITGTGDSAAGVLRLGLDGDVTRALQVGMVNGATADELEAALNALPSVKALQAHDEGSVTVELKDGAYVIHFNSLGDHSLLTAAGTFSVLPTLDIYRVGNGDGANGDVSVTTTAAGSIIGPVVTTAADGTAGSFEAQLINLQGQTDNFSLTFDERTSSPLGAGTNAENLQNVLNRLYNPDWTIDDPLALEVVLATSPDGSYDPNGTPIEGLFRVSFLVSGDQPQIIGNGTVNEVITTEPGAAGSGEFQQIDLNNLPASGRLQLRIGNNAATLDLSGKSQEEIRQTIETTLQAWTPVSVNINSANVFDVAFLSEGNKDLIEATSFVASQTLQGGTESERQQIDLTELLTINGDSFFQLSFGGDTSIALAESATAGEVELALQALLPGATVTGADGLFEVTFSGTADQTGLILATAGAQETQNIDPTGIAGAEYELNFNGEAVKVPVGASASQVEGALNGLGSIQAAGGVAVTDAQSGFDVKFNRLGNQSEITATFEVFARQILDLQQLPADNGLIKLSFNGTTAPAYLSVDATALEIQASLQSIGANTTVAQLHPGVFQITFNESGARPVIGGVYNPVGATYRLASSASAFEIESALDNVSVADITLTTADGLHYLAYFEESGEQLPLQGTARTHEQLNADIFESGNFTLRVDGDFTIGASTIRLPANATADQIRLALNSLDEVQDLGGVANVTVLPDSSFNVTFAGDLQLAPVNFVARQDIDTIPTITSQDGNASMVEVQSINYASVGAFSLEQFRQARLVGAIVDVNEINSNQFHFFPYSTAGVPLSLVPVTAAEFGRNFQQGDLPYDGIVMAKTVDALNFIPEALLTSAGFFDNLNRVS